MKKVAQFTKNKLALFAVVVAATAVGGATTAVVSASIPDSGGTIHGCYRNSAGLLDPKGSLRVINTDSSETCTAQETALDWSQNHTQIAYGHVVGTYDVGTSSWSYQLDTGRASGITIQYVADDEDSGAIDACITAAFQPKNISLTGGNTFPPSVAVRTNGLNGADGNWSSPKANAVCGSGGANAFIYNVGNDTWFTLYE